MDNQMEDSGRDPSGQALAVPVEPVARLDPTGFDPSRWHRWERLCLADDPFAGDYGGSGSNDGVLSDRLVTNRGGGTCSTCGGACEPGTRNRVRAEVYDGEFMRFRWCVRCCFGMAVYGMRPSILDARIASAIETASETPKGNTQ